MEKLLSCIIIEDDSFAAEMAEDIILGHFKNVAITAIISDVATALLRLQEKQPDFVILDVNLKDGNAFELLKGLPQIDFKIIFTTSFDKYAVRAFRFSALDYLLKPYLPSDLVQAVEKVISALDHAVYTEQWSAFYHNLDTSDADRKLVLKNLDAIHIVAVKDIVYIASDNNYSQFFLKDDKKLLASKTLKTYEEQLKDSGFLRVHQRFLINMDHIRSYHKKNDMLLLSGNREVPVSQSRKAVLTRFLDGL